MESIMTMKGFRLAAGEGPNVAKLKEALRRMSP